jgi:hypothetical protein
VTICSPLFLFISSKIVVIVVDLPDQAGHDTITNQLFKSTISFAHSGNISSSGVLTFISIFLITNEIFPSLKKALTLNVVHNCDK